MIISTTAFLLISVLPFCTLLGIHPLEKHLYVKINKTHLIFILTIQNPIHIQIGIFFYSLSKGFPDWKKCVGGRNTYTQGHRNIGRVSRKN